MENIPINSSLKTAIESGSKIVEAGNDGFDWHVLVENKKGSVWRFTIYSTAVASFGSSSFSPRKDMNHHKRKAKNILSKRVFDRTLENLNKPLLAIVK